MREILPMLICFISLGCGRRTHVLSEGVQSYTSAEIRTPEEARYAADARSAFHPTRSLSILLLLLKPVAAFSPYDPAYATSHFVNLNQGLGHGASVMRMSDKASRKTEQADHSMAAICSRRGALSIALWTSMGMLSGPASAAVAPSITSKVQLTVEIKDSSRSQQADIILGLYGDAAPAYVDLFKQVCSGSVPGEPELSFNAGRFVRAYNVQRGRFIEFGEPESRKVQVSEIDFTGRLRTKSELRPARITNAASSGLSHNRAGLLSMRRDGEALDFLLTTGADPSLDAGYTVIGEVISGTPVITAIDSLPTFKKSEVALIGGTTALYGIRGGLSLSVGLYVGSRLTLPFGIGAGLATAAAMSFVGDDPRAYEEANVGLRPVTKVNLVRARLLEDVGAAMRA